jgi:tRNA 2-selenouridine synthase
MVSRVKQATHAGISQAAEFDSVIDVRSPSEFAIDHMPGAVNFPVLDDRERAEIGTIYRQVSTFEARKRGAALVAQNIAKHLLTPYFAGRERGWKPLVYCWRGGQRSGAMTHILREIGWDAAQVGGGYKTYRAHVVSALSLLPGRFDYRVICGETGSGKSRLLRALAAAGAQVLDLEQAALHRGSVLGNLPDCPQPSQKAFDTALWHAFTRFDHERPIYVEAESKKVGELRVPEALMEAMWASPCLRVELGFDQRVKLLQEEYAHFFRNPDGLCGKLDALTALHGRAVIENWKSLARSADWRELTADLLSRHYDPAYRRSTARNYPRLQDAIVVACSDPSDAGMAQIAREIVRADERAHTPA